MENNITTIYMPLKDKQGKNHKKTVSIGFNDNEADIQKALIKLGSAGVRNAIKIFSYNHLMKLSNKENIPASALIKKRLKDHVIDGIPFGIEVDKKLISEIKKVSNILLEDQYIRERYPQCVLFFEKFKE